MNYVDYNNFSGLDIRVGTIQRVDFFEKALNPAYKLWIDFGEMGIKKSSAQITTNYKPEVLLNKQVIAIINFKPKQIADFMSECLVLGVYETQESIVLLQPDKLVENGTKIG
jgi:tRNA-binding protein